MQPTRSYRPHRKRRRPFRCHGWSVTCAVWVCTLITLRVYAESVDFHTDVIAALSKAGCNAGRCHGNANGRGGFKLSLRGQIPADDYLAITREGQSRRINRVQPQESLLLLKATAQVPHEGGLRFSAQAPEYAALLGWIAAGMPYQAQSAHQLQRIEVQPRSAILGVDSGGENSRELQLRVTAYFDDGTARDVTDMAVYEPADSGVEVSRAGKIVRRKFGQSTVVVRYLQQQAAVEVAFLDSAPAFNFDAPIAENAIDAAVFRQLRRLRMNPSQLTSDTEFLRRVHLDLTGRLPTARVARRVCRQPIPRKACPCHRTIAGQRRLRGSLGTCLGRLTAGRRKDDGRRRGARLL